MGQCGGPPPADAAGRALQPPRRLLERATFGELIRQAGGLRQPVAQAQPQHPPGRLLEATAVPDGHVGRGDAGGGEVFQGEDDKPEAVKRRIQVYADETEPLIEFYRRRGKLEEIDGGGSIETVGRSLAAVVA